MMKFKKDDKVKILGISHVDVKMKEKIIGMVGTIIYIDDSESLQIAVNVLNRPDLNGFHFNESELELVKPIPLSQKQITKHPKCPVPFKHHSAMHDSGKRQEFQTGAVRDTAEGKSRPDLISPYAQMRKGEWLRLGAEKYAERNWEKGLPIGRCIASMERHIQEYKMGLLNEDHLAAIAVNAEFIMHFEAMIERGLLPQALDDMPKYEQQKNKSAKYRPDDLRQESDGHIELIGNNL